MAEHEPERIEARMGDKSVGISTRDLIPLVTLIIATVAGYFLWQTITLGIRAVYQREGEILHRLEEQDEKLAYQTREFARLLAIHDFNTDRPIPDRLPMEIDLSWLPKPPTGEIPIRRRAEEPKKRAD